MNPAVVAFMQLFACGAHISKAHGISHRVVQWLPNYWWGCICAPLPMDVCVEAVLVGCELIIVGLADRMSEAPN